MAWIMDNGHQGDLPTVWESFLVKVREMKSIEAAQCYVQRSGA